MFDSRLLSNQSLPSHGRSFFFIFSQLSLSIHLITSSLVQSSIVSLSASDISYPLIPLSEPPPPRSSIHPSVRLSSPCVTISFTVRLTDSRVIAASGGPRNRVTPLWTWMGCGGELMSGGLVGVTVYQRCDSVTVFSDVH